MSLGNLVKRSGVRSCDPQPRLTPACSPAADTSTLHEKGLGEMATNVVVAPAASGCSSSGQSIGLRSWESQAPACRVRLAKTGRHSFVLHSDLLARFDAAVVRSGPGECWGWTAAKDDKGYGRIFVAKAPACLRAMKAHRLAVLISGKDIGPGQEVTHSCDNPGCVNPDHLSLKTHAENMAEMASRGRRRGPEHAGLPSLNPKPTSARKTVSA